MSWSNYQNDDYGRLPPVGEDAVYHHSEGHGGQWHQYDQHPRTKQKRTATYNNKYKPQSTKNPGPWVVQDAPHKEGEAAASASMDWQNVTAQDVQQQKDKEHDQAEAMKDTKKHGHLIDKSEPFNDETLLHGANQQPRICSIRLPRSIAATVTSSIIG